MQVYLFMALGRRLSCWQWPQYTRRGVHCTRRLALLLSSCTADARPSL